MTLFFSFDFNGDVGTPKLTELAADAIFGPSNGNFFVLIQSEHLFGTKLHTDPAPFAPARINVVFF
jgi:hypothetical protein